MLKLLGTGAFAVVRLGVERRTGEYVAIKIIDKSRVAMTLGAAAAEAAGARERARARRMFEREIEILKLIDHVCVGTSAFVRLTLHLAGGGEVFGHV